MKPIKVFVPFRFKTLAMPPNCSGLKERFKQKFQQVYVNFIKMFGSNIGKQCFFTSNFKLENKFSKGESMRHEI